MSKQVRLYCWLALIISMSSVGFGLYEKDSAFEQSHLNGVLYFQNTDLKNRNSELEGKLINARQQAFECKTKR